MLHRLFFYWPAPKSKPIHLASLCCPLPGREPPPSARPSSPFVWLSYLSPCLFFATPHQTFQASESFTTFLFSLAPRSPLKSQILLRPFPNLSHWQSHHAWMRHGCANAWSLPIGAFVCQCECGGKPLIWGPEWCLSPERGVVRSWDRWTFVGITAVTWEIENKLIVLNQSVPKITKVLTFYPFQLCVLDHLKNILMF